MWSVFVVLLILLQSIDKNMKLIWLKGVKELTAKCHKQWMAALLRKSIGRLSWSCERLGRPKTALFQEEICLLALVAWSKGKLDRFNERRYCKTDNRNIDAVENCSAHQWLERLDTSFSLKKYLWVKMSKILTFFYFFIDCFIIWHICQK